MHCWEGEDNYKIAKGKSFWNELSLMFSSGAAEVLKHTQNYMCKQIMMTIVLLYWLDYISL